MWGLIRAVRYESMNLWKLFHYLVINIVKGNTVMYIARGYFHCQNNTVNIAGGMCFISQLLFVVSLNKQTTVGVGGTDSNDFFLCFLLAFL